ncbi:MAG: hypothetical protein H0V41_13245 [Pseudonocardiales bacterium]|nr:hypothetical protein [Pseudonocardiales bacterium]
MTQDDHCAHTWVLALESQSHSRVMVGGEVSGIADGSAPLRRAAVDE